MKGNETRSVLPIFILTLLNATTVGTLFTLISMYASSYFGANTVEVGLLSSSNALSMLLLTIPSGLLSDRFGRKAVLMLSLIVNVSSFLILYYANGFLMLLIPMILSGIAFGTFGPTMQSLVAA